MPTKRCYRQDSSSIALRFVMPPPRRGGGIKLSSASVVRPSVRLSVCLMSRTSALTRKPKGLGRRNFAQGYPRSRMRLPHRLQGQKVKSQGQQGWGACCGGHLAAQLVKYCFLPHNIHCVPKSSTPNSLQ